MGLFGIPYEREKLISNRDSVHDNKYHRHLPMDDPLKKGIKMNRQSVAREVRIKAGVTREKSHEAVNAIFRVMREALVEEGRIEIRGFGIFKILKKKERAGRNPKTGAPAVIKARKVVTFKAGGRMYDRVLKGE